MDYINIISHRGWYSLFYLGDNRLKTVLNTRSILIKRFSPKVIDLNIIFYNLYNNRHNFVSCVTIDLLKCLKSLS